MPGLLVACCSDELTETRRTRPSHHVHLAFGLPELGCGAGV